MILPKRKAEIISNGIFLIALGILFWFNSWWPGILLAIWAGLGTRQYLTGRTWDFAITTGLLFGLFIVSLFNIDLSILVPILFVVAGIYIILREYFYTDEKKD